jgi:hypothetical protein
LSLLANHWRASSYVQRPERAYRNEHTTQHHFRRSRWLSTTAELTIRGGGKPYSNMALDADRKNGPAARSFAADAHDCIMVRIKRPYRIQVCGTKMRPQWRAPLGFSKIDRHRQTLKLCRKKAPVAGHHRSACSGVKALRNTSDARRQAAKLCYRFGPLTPSARSANLIAGDGTKNGFPAPNKEPAKTKNHHLTGKAPYKFESISLQRRVRNEPLRGRTPGAGSPSRRRQKSVSSGCLSSGYRWFESTSHQQRVYELSVPERRTLNDKCDARRHLCPEV